MRNARTAVGAALLSAAVVVGGAGAADAVTTRSCDVAKVVTLRVTASSANNWTSLKYSGTPYRKVVRKFWPDMHYRFSSARVPSKGLRSTRPAGTFKYRGTSPVVVEGKWYVVGGIFSGWQTCTLKIGP